MAGPPIQTWTFVVVVIRDGDKYLLVKEKKYGQVWYLPAGTVEVGETFAEAAHRETMEEAGIEIELEGILRVEHIPADNGSRLRVIYLARPKGEKEAPQDAKLDTLGTKWVTFEEALELPLRGGDVPQYLKAMSEGMPAYPLSIIAREGDDYK